MLEPDLFPVLLEPLNQAVILYLVNDVGGLPRERTLP